MGLGAGRSPHPAPRQLRDEHPAQRREENRPARITRGRTSRAPAARRGHHRLSRRYPPRRCPATSRSRPPLRGHHHSGRGARAMAGSTRPVHRGAPRHSGETDPCKTRCVRSGRNGQGQIKAPAVIQLEPDQAGRFLNEAAIATRPRASPVTLKIEDRLVVAAALSCWRILSASSPGRRRPRLARVARGLISLFVASDGRGRDLGSPASSGRESLRGPQLAHLPLAGSSSE